MTDKKNACYIVQEGRRNRYVCSDCSSQCEFYSEYLNHSTFKVGCEWQYYGKYCACYRAKASAVRALQQTEARAEARKDAR